MPPVRHCSFLPRKLKFHTYGTEVPTEGTELSLGAFAREGVIIDILLSDKNQKGHIMGAQP